MEQKTKSEGFFSFLSNAIKKELILPQQIKFIIDNLKIISEEIHRVSKSISSLTAVVQEHSSAINELYNVQLFLLRQIKSQNIGTETLDIDIKNKPDKPN